MKINEVELLSYLKDIEIYNLAINEYDTTYELDTYDWEKVREGKCKEVIRDKKLYREVNRKAHLIFLELVNKGVLKPDYEWIKTGSFSVRQNGASFIAPCAFEDKEHNQTAEEVFDYVINYYKKKK
ncbi:MAG: hypothetical protein LBM99_01795 [Bacillales bacterium]|jgi:hypothetical protein|nr:hypothetical protein [Bacillales bacterium]